MADISTQYSLGPLKSRLHRELGSTNSQFSLMISALKYVFQLTGMACFTLLHVFLAWPQLFHWLVTRRLFTNGLV